MKNFILISAILAISASCTKAITSAVELSSVPIAFTVEENGFDISTKSVNETKLSNLSSIKVSAFSNESGTTVWNDKTFTQGSGTFNASMYWPSTNQNYIFYASNWNITNKDGKFVVIPNTSTKDIVCGVKDSSDEYLAVNTIILKHIFTRIGKIIMSSKIGYTITDLSLSMIPMIPDQNTYYDIASSSWSNAVAGSAIEFADGETGSNECDFLLIPGKYKFKASWTANKGAGNMYSERFTNVYSDEIELKPGYKYTISCTFGGNATDLQFKFTVEDWETNNLSIEF